MVWHVHQYIEECWFFVYLNQDSCEAGDGGYLDTTKLALVSDHNLDPLSQNNM